MADRMARTDVLLVSLGGTAGLRAADGALAGALRRAGAAVAVARVARTREVRTFALTDLAWALPARAAARAAIRDAAPRAIVYSSTTAALLWPEPGAIRFDAPAAGNRPGAPRRLAAAGRAAAVRGRAAAAAVERGRAGRGPVAARGRARRAGARRAVRAGGGRARPRRDHLRREPAQEGHRPRARRLARGAAAGRGARRRRAGRATDEDGRPLRGDDPAGRVPRAAAPRPRLRHRAAARGLRDRPARGARRRRAARHDAAPGPYAALPLARALDPRLVGDDLAAAIRAALDDPAPDYAERAAAARRAVDARGGRRARRRPPPPGAPRRVAVVSRA